MSAVYPSRMQAAVSYLAIGSLPPSTLLNLAPILWAIARVGIGFGVGLWLGGS